MKYGQKLERQSVPQWSLHNLDYNSLKYEIKVHTTRDQASASAIAIPGHQDKALHKFEDGLYFELCRQHERVDMFVSSKANEISRRLVHLESSIKRWIGRCPDHPILTESLKEQRRFAKYERELLQCGDDIHHISRFANAQVIAFRKIVKKYKKWTGSLTLGARFSENILSDPKSFTRRDFIPLRLRYDGILTALRNATSPFSEPSSPSSDGHPSFSRPGSSSQHPDVKVLPPRQHRYRQQQEQQQQQPLKYWNEYDDGSETGGPEENYAIYVDPGEGNFFPGIAYVHAVLSLPFEKVKQLFHPRRNREHQPLLSETRPSTYNSNTTVNTDSDEEGYASSCEIPSHGYAAHYAFPSVGEQQLLRYRENVLLWATIGLYATSFALLAICGVLISTGRHKLRVEVDAAVTIGVAMSLFCSCSALGAALYRKDHLSIPYRIMVWSTFVASCILNGMLLILVMGNAP